MEAVDFWTMTSREQPKSEKNQEFLFLSFLPINDNNAVNQDQKGRKQDFKSFSFSIFHSFIHSSTRRSSTDLNSDPSATTIMLSLLPAFLLVFLSFPLQSFSWASIPQTDPQFQRQFSSDFQIKIPRSRQSQTDGFFSENTSSGPEGDSIYTLYNYRNIDYQNSDIKKVVIQIAGQGRDACEYTQNSK